jgi:para-aminobenzoate synthetase component 1
MTVKAEKLDGNPGAERLFSLLCEVPSALLDSSLRGGSGRYSLAGFYPYLTAEEKNGQLMVNGQPRPGNLLDFLKAYLKEHKETNPLPLPLSAGAIGYLTYDHGRERELPPSENLPGPDMPEGMFRFYDLLIVEDLKKGETWICSEEKQHDLAWYGRRIRACTGKKNGKEAEGRRKEIPEDAGRERRQAVFSDFSRKEYMEAIVRMQEHIRAGDIYVANMTRQLRLCSGEEPYQVFSRLRRRNPSPFGAFLREKDFSVICASPERFLRVKNGQVQTRPIKGTRPRGKDAEEDRLLRKELEDSEKDRSELLMIVDLERNDLNRVCKPGSVRVTELFAIEEYATVFHLVSTVQGTLREDCGAADLLQAAFPGGSITGAPKIRAMEIIEELERSRRGLYTGTAGYLSLNGDCDLNIIIRTAIYQNGVYYLGAGGGITFESEPEAEYEETWQKARAVVEAIQGAGGRKEKEDGNDHSG